MFKKMLFLTTMAMLGMSCPVFAVHFTFWTGAVSTNPADPCNWSDGLPGTADVAAVGINSDWQQVVLANSPVLTSQYGNSDPNDPNGGWWILWGQGGQNSLTVGDGAYMVWSKDDCNLRNGAGLTVAGRNSDGGPSLVIPPRFRIGQQGDDTINYADATSTIVVKDNGYLSFNPSIATTGSGGDQIYIGGEINALIEVRDNGTLETVTGTDIKSGDTVSPRFVFGSSDPAKNKIVVNDNGQLILAGDPNTIGEVDSNTVSLSGLISMGLITSDTGIVTVTGSNPTVVSTVTPAPVADWPLDGNAVDVAGGHDGTPIGNVTWVDGFMNGAAYFDMFDMNDPNAGILVPSSSDLDFGSQSFSISMMVRYPTAPVGESCLILKGTFGAPDTGKRYVVFDKNGEMRFEIDDNVTKSGVRASDANFVGGDWVNLVAVRDADANTLSLYANGVLQSTGDASGTGDISNGEDMYIGSYPGGEKPAQAAIDNVRIYNVALTQGMINGITQSAVVNVDFARKGHEQELVMSGQGAYADPGNNVWNVANREISPVDNLLTSDGQATGLSISTDAPSWSNVDSNYIPNPINLMGDYLYAHNNSYSVVVSGLYSDTGYTLYLYSTGDSPLQGAMFTIGDVNVAFPGGDPNTPNITQGEDYQSVNVVSDPNGDLNIIFANIPENSEYGCFHGLQLIGPMDIQPMDN